MSSFKYNIPKEKINGIMRRIKDERRIDPYSLGFGKDTTKQLCRGCLNKPDGKDGLKFFIESQNVLCHSCGFQDDINALAMRINGDGVMDHIKRYAPDLLDSAQRDAEHESIREDFQAYQAPPKSNKAPKLNFILSKYCQIAKTQEDVDKLLSYLCGIRGHHQEYMLPLIQSGQIRLKIHGQPGTQVSCVATAFTSLQGDQVGDIQVFTLDENPFPHKPGEKPTKRKFQPKTTGADIAGVNAFNQFGCPIHKAKRAVIVESMNDALSLLPLIDDETAILNIGGSGLTKKLEAIKPHLPHLQQIISAGDNDHAGQKMNQDIKAILGDKVVAFPWNPDDKPGLDLNNLEKSGQGERIRAGINAPVEIKTLNDSTEDGWEPPTPLDDPPVERLPKDLFPGVIGAMSNELSRASETPLELPDAIVLGCTSAACHGKFVIEIVPGAYCEPLNLWLYVVLDPGNRKSFIVTAASRPLNNWEKSERIRLEPEIKEAESKRKRQDARLKALRAQYSKAPKDQLEDIEDEIKLLEDELVEIPRPPQVWTQDVTTEHCATLASQNNERIAVISAEGGVLENIGGRYSNGVSNMDFFLQGHSNDPVKVDRGSRESLNMDRPSVVMALAVQHDVLKSLIAKNGFAGRGFLDRPAYLIPPSNLGYRKHNGGAIDPMTQHEYEAMITRLLNIEEPEEPHILKLSNEAYQEWDEFRRAFEITMRPGEEFADHTGWASKAPGLAARIAGVFHCSLHLEMASEIPVDVDTMRRAIDFTAILSRHALLAFDKMGEDSRLGGARKVWGWIQKQKQPVLKRKALFDAMRSTYPTVEELRAPLSILEERSFIKQEKGSVTGKGRPSEVIVVNPELARGW